jgi:hypothetical protein
MPDTKIEVILDAWIDPHQCHWKLKKLVASFIAVTRPRRAWPVAAHVCAIMRTIERAESVAGACLLQTKAVAVNNGSVMLFDLDQGRDHGF